MPTSAIDAQRRLLAVLHADVVGYSARMGADEAGTHAALRGCLDLANEIIGAHDGRLVGTAGDAFLGAFESVVQAVKAAAAFQSGIEARNTELPQAQRLLFRVGVNLGDVIVDRADIFGDGVNVAARVQALAEPGGVAVTGAVRDQIGNRLDVAFEDRGTHRVKNIAEPVRVYAIRSASAVGTTSHRTALTTRIRRRVLLVLIAVAVTAVAMATAVFGPIWLEKQSTGPPDSGRPTIAVLPFDDLGTDATEAYFSAGVTEDIIGQLGRFSGLLVLSWNAVAPYQNSTVSVQDLSRELGVRYVVGGSIRRSPDMLRLSVQLTDAEEGVLLWSERYDQPLADLFALQDRISRLVVGKLAVQLTEIERRRGLEKPTESLGAYDLVLRGRALLQRAERDANLDARGLFQRAIEVDPDYAEAYLGLGWTYLADLLWGWTEWPSEAIEQAESLATKAIGLSPDNARARALRADILLLQRRFEEAEVEVLRALELNPNDAISHAIHGTLLLHSGRHKDAIPRLELALRLDPHAPNWAIVNLAQAYYFDERAQDAVRVLTRSDRDFAEDPGGPAVLAASLAALGREDEARAEADTVRRLYPFFNARVFAENVAGPRYAVKLIEGLNRAGLE